MIVRQHTPLEATRIYIIGHERTASHTEQNL